MLLHSPFVPVGYRFAEVLDAAAIETGLRGAIDAFPMVAARLRRRAQDPNGYVLSLKKSRGVPLTVHTLPHAAAPESAENPGTKSWDRFFHRAKDEILEYTSSMPPLTVHVALLPASGATVLTVSVMHVVADGAAISHFLKTFSHLAGLAAGVAPRPAEAPPPPVLDRTAPFDAAELAAVAADKRKAHVKMSKTEMARFAGNYSKARLRTCTHDFAISLAGLQKLKGDVSAHLAEAHGDRAWVSSYEVMMAMFVKALGAADHPASYTGDLKTRILVNTRGRGALTPVDHFGNALDYVPISFPAAAHQSEHWLAEMAWVLHQELRSATADARAMDDLVYQYEDAVKNCGAMNNAISRTFYLKPWLQNFIARDSVCNSWIGYNWFDASFGAAEEPDLIRVPKDFKITRMLFVAPRSRTELLFRFSDHPAKVRALAKALHALALPVRSLEGGAKPLPAPKAKTSTALASPATPEDNN